MVASNWVSRVGGFAVLAMISGTCPALGDELIYGYEGNVLPYHASAGWLTFDACDHPCIESTNGGKFVLTWTEFGKQVNYHFWIARPPEIAPASIWVEWRLQSNNPIPSFSYTCDAAFAVKYGEVSEPMYLFADAAVSFSGGDFILGLSPNEFHYFRFESLDGVNYSFSVDGTVFSDGVGFQGSGFSYLQLQGHGGCGLDLSPVINEWDFVRYGTISYGERIVGSEPAAGFLDIETHGNLTSFIVTYDSPNYAYIDEITVDVSGCSGLPNDPCTATIPKVIATRRLDNGPPDVLEIVLDRPIPAGKRTRFIFDDGVMINTVSYTYIHGDSDADDDIDLLDIAAFQNCFGVLASSPHCHAFDFDEDLAIDPSDFEELHSFIAGPSE